jgi:hypothetical protein
MKRLFFTLFAAFFFSSFIKAQTTQEDYNYITKGYQDDIEKGKGIKTGYNIKEIQSQTAVTVDGIRRYVTVYYFRKGLVNKAFLVKCNDSVGNTRYMCIPSANSDSDLWDQMFSDFASTGKEWNVTFVYALSRLTSQKLL